MQRTMKAIAFKIPLGRKRAFRWNESIEFIFHSAFKSRTGALSAGFASTRIERLASVSVASCPCSSKLPRRWFSIQPVLLGGQARKCARKGCVDFQKFYRVHRYLYVNEFEHSLGFIRPLNEFWPLNIFLNRVFVFFCQDTTNPLTSNFFVRVHSCFDNVQEFF